MLKRNCSSNFPKIFLFFYTIIFFIVTIIFLNLNYKKHSTFIDSWNSIVNKENWEKESLNFQNRKFLKDDIISGSFISKEKNLGTIAIYFDNNDKDNQGTINFVLKNDNTNTIVYQNDYPIDKINIAYPYTFGFPLIKDSKNVPYSFRITSLDSIEDEALNLNTHSYFLVKHVFSKNAVLSDLSLIIDLIVNKTALFFKPIFDNIFITIFIFSFGYIFILSAISFFYNFAKPISKYILKYSHIFYPLSLFLITFLITTFFARINVDPHHDGILLKPAIDVSRGKILFKETFSQYGFLTVYLQGLFIRIFGEYLIVIRILTAFFYSLISVLLYFIWNKILSSSLSFFSGFIFILLAPFYYFTFLPWPSVYALLFQLLVLFNFIKFILNKKIKHLFFAGFLTGITFWFKQNIGIYVGLPAIISIVILNDKKDFKSLFYLLKKYLFGLVLSILPILLFILTQGALMDWFKQSFLYAASWAKFFGKKYGFMNSLFPISKSSISIWALMPIVTLLLIIRSLFENKSENNKVVMIISLFSIFSWLQYYPISDIRHSFWAAAPMIGLFTYFTSNLLPKIIQSRKTKYTRIFCIFIILPLFFFKDIHFRINEGYKKYNSNYVSIEKPSILKNMKVESRKAKQYLYFYKHIENYLIKHPKSNIVTIGPDALYLLFGRSNNFHPMYVSWSTINNSIYRDYPSIMASYIDHNKPLIISFGEHMIEGYCSLTSDNHRTRIIVPCENISK